MANCSGNRFQHAVPILHDIMIVESKNAITFHSEKRISSRIALHLFRFKLLAAVELNDQH